MRFVTRCTHGMVKKVGWFEKIRRRSGAADKLEYFCGWYRTFYKYSAMPYNEKLADRVRELISLTHKNIEEKRMFGGLCFMVNDKMCIGVEKDRLMVRLDPEKYDEVIQKEGCKPMDFTGKPMKGYVFVSTDVLNTKAKLAYWIGLALDYNKVAKASRKKN
ncbi:MAG TPA: TfoX/Sxy family protein [Puia sp.]|nr:TfoX/Sxy family protein [Puia sp.]